MTEQPITEAPKLTPTQRAHELMQGMIAALTAAMTKRTTMQRESNTATRNAKGDVQLETVAYRQDDEAEDDFNARTEARFDRLCAKYPLSRTQEYGRAYLPNEKGK